MSERYIVKSASDAQPDEPGIWCDGPRASAFIAKARNAGSDEVWRISNFAEECDRRHPLHPIVAGVIDTHDDWHRARATPRYIVKPASEMAEGEPCARLSGWSWLEAQSIVDGTAAHHPVKGGYHDASDLCFSVWIGCSADRSAIIDTHSPEWQAFQRERGKAHTWKADPLRDGHRCTCGAVMYGEDVRAGRVPLGIVPDCAVAWGCYRATWSKPRTAAVVMGSDEPQYSTDRSPESHRADRKARAKLLGHVLGGVDTRPSDHAEAMGYAWRHVVGVDPGKGDSASYALVSIKADTSKARAAVAMLDRAIEMLKPPAPTDAEIVAAWEAVWRWNEAPAATRGSAPHGCEWDLDGKLSVVHIGPKAAPHATRRKDHDEARSRELRRLADEAREKERCRVVVQVDDLHADDCL
jgi:hypothetical protein